MGAYAAKQREPVLSDDIDLYTTTEGIYEILDWLPTVAATVVKRPQPRALPVAVVDWKGKEINLLSQSDGLPPPAVVLRFAREFEYGDVKILLADPFDLLANKRAVNREKDRVHVEILYRFICEEAVYSCREGRSPRERLEPARRLLRVLDSRELPADLAERLIGVSRDPAVLRFLANHAPTKEQVDRVLEAARDSDLLGQLRKMADRRFGPR